jgi:hypothetical protein
MMKRFELATREATGVHKSLLLQIYSNRCFLSEAKKSLSREYESACRSLIIETAQAYRTYSTAIKHIKL